MWFRGHVPGRSSSEGKEDHFSWLDKIEGCPVYHPSKEEFDDPFLYLHRIAPEASKYGMTNVGISCLCLMSVKNIVMHLWKTISSLDRVISED